jgi:hypothetical protein
VRRNGGHDERELTTARRWSRSTTMSTCLRRGWNASIPRSPERSPRSATQSLPPIPNRPGCCPSICKSGREAVHGEHARRQVMANLAVTSSRPKSAACCKCRLKCRAALFLNVHEGFGVSAAYTYIYTLHYETVELVIPPTRTHQRDDHRRGTQQSPKTPLPGWINPPRGTSTRHCSTQHIGSRSPTTAARRRIPQCAFPPRFCA